MSTLTNQQRREAFMMMPPHAIEAEGAMLGCILVDPSVLPLIRQIVPNEEYFVRPYNSTIYRAMLRTYDREGTLDLILLNQHLEDAGEMKAAGGLDYLVQLASAFPNAAHAQHYARLVRDKHLLHRAMIVAGDLIYYLQHDAVNCRQRLETAIADMKIISALFATPGAGTTISTATDHKE